MPEATDPFDCQSCGACCAYDASWPVVEPEDLGPHGPPPELVLKGAMRWTGSRCAALDGEIGACVGCTIYARRPRVCRDCEPGSVSCRIARRFHGLPVPEEQSSLDALLGWSSGPRVR